MIMKVARTVLALASAFIGAIMVEAWNFSATGLFGLCAAGLTLFAVMAYNAE